MEIKFTYLEFTLCFSRVYFGYNWRCFGGTFCNRSSISLWCKTYLFVKLFSRNTNAAFHLWHLKPISNIEVVMLPRLLCRTFHIHMKTKLSSSPSSTAFSEISNRNNFICETILGKTTSFCSPTKLFTYSFSLSVFFYFTIFCSIWVDQCQADDPVQLFYIPHVGPLWPVQ